MKIILHPFICFLFILPVSAKNIFADQRDFLIKVGVMKPATPTKDRLRETNIITMDPTRKPGFCFIVDPPSAIPYDVYSVSYLPKRPKELTGTFQDMAPSRAMTGIKSRERQVKGIWPFCFHFDYGDPIGQYVIEAFINNTLKTSLNLHVVPQKAKPPSDSS